MKMINLIKSNEETSIIKGFESFQEFNKAKNLSDKTIAFYEDCIKYFREIF